MTDTAPRADRAPTKGAWPVVPGVPATGHVTGRGIWHPGPIDGCAKCGVDRGQRRLSVLVAVGGASFGDDDVTQRLELGRIYACVAGAVASGQTDGAIVDGLGNTVGSWEVSPA